MTGNFILSRKFSLLASVSFPFGTDFIGKLLIHFYSIFIGSCAKGVGSLFDAVSTIFFFISESQMFRIITCAIVAAWALVKHAHAFWNWAFEKYISHSVRAGDLTCITSSNSSVYCAISSMNRACPNPTSSNFTDSYFGKKPVVNRGRKFLRLKINRVKVWLHNVKFRLALCRALGYANNARASLFSPISAIIAT